MFNPYGSSAATPLCAAAVALGLALAFASPAAHAGLGGSADSVATDNHVLRGQLVSIPEVQYDVQQINAGADVVREYVTRSGVVFAVTWSGPTLPDLQTLLGSYFPQFQSAAQAAQLRHPGIHRQLSINGNDLVVDSAGRLRDFHGIAYVPSLVPQGVSIDELQ
jgi:hypothetical protein